MSRRRTRDELANLDWLMDRDHANTVPCPICHQPAGQACTNPITGEEHPAPAHWQRIHTADQESKPWPTSPTTDHPPPPTHLNNAAPPRLPSPPTLKTRPTPPNSSTPSDS